MTVRTLYTLATALCLGLAGFVTAQEPPAANSNQKLADEVIARIISSGVATGAKMIDVKTLNGVVEISGTVVSANQIGALVQQAMSVPGTVKVQTSLKIVEVQQTNAVGAPISELPPTAPHSLDILTPPIPSNPQMQQTVGVPPAPSPMQQEPLPLGQGAQTQPSYDQTGPKLPPYAWPTYAPYPNMSRVAYPQAYPYNAFPFIGPFYPFPKVPLGWRSVKLEWDDGHWYIGRLSTPHDYWRVRFW